MIFQDGPKKDLSFNQPTIVKLDRIPNTEEVEVPKIYVIPAEMVDFDNGLYQGVYVSLQFKTEDRIYRREDKTEVNSDPDDEHLTMKGILNGEW